MIEIFESRPMHLTRCVERARQAAEGARNDEARRIHQWLAENYERQAIRHCR